MDEPTPDAQMTDDLGALADRLSRLPEIASTSEIQSELAAILERLRVISQRNERERLRLAASLGLGSSPPEPLQ